MTRVLDQHHGAAAGTTSTTDGGEDWRHRAACLDTDPELWFPADEERANRRKPRVAEAKAVCDACPVQPDCLRWALEHDIREGVWGGLDEDERPHTRRATRKPAAPKPAAPTKARPRHPAILRTPTRLRSPHPQRRNPMRHLQGMARPRETPGSRMTSHDAYRRAREDRLTTLLEDPESWRFIAAHALDVRDTHQHGTPAWSALTRLHHVAAELTRLADEPQQRKTA